VAMMPGSVVTCLGVLCPGLMALMLRTGLAHGVVSWPITDEGVVVGATFDSDTAVGKCRLRTRAAGVLASR
jgi:hypothetical protein